MITFSKEELEQLTPAFEAIGSNAEHDFTPQQCTKLARSLRLLADFVEHSGNANGFRVGNNMTDACREQYRAEAAFDCLPTEFKW